MLPWTTSPRRIQRRFSQWNEFPGCQVMTSGTRLAGSGCRAVANASAARSRDKTTLSFPDCCRLRLVTATSTGLSKADRATLSFLHANSETLYYRLHRAHSARTPCSARSFT